MEKLIKWLENSFQPKMNIVNTNVWILTLKDSMLQVLPFIFVGSIFCMGTVLESFVTLPFSFWTPYGWTMGLVSLFVSFLIPFNFCEKKRLRKSRLIAGMTGISTFLISITPEVLAEGEAGFGSSALGAGGMFCAMITGIIVCIVFNLFGKFSFFKEDSVIPDFVRQWFDALLPIGITVFAFFLLVQVAGVDLYSIAVNIFMPLQGIANTWYGFTLIIFIYCFIYSMGISSWVLTPVAEPIKLATIAANLALIASGEATAANQGIYTETLVYVTYMWWGGIGCTMPLVLEMMFMAKSQKLKALGRACIAPAIFNINEPVVFGTIAWNPIMMLPMWIIGIVMPLLTWFGVKVIQFAPFNIMQFELWYCPYPIGTWISTGGSIAAIIFVIIEFLVAAAIYFPFMKAYDKQCCDEEGEKESKKVAAKATA